MRAYGFIRTLRPTFLERLAQADEDERYYLEVGDAELHKGDARPTLLELVSVTEAEANRIVERLGWTNAVTFYYGYVLPSHTAGDGEIGAFTRQTFFDGKLIRTEMHFARDQQNLGTLIHELAHVVATPYGGHEARFTKAHQRVLDAWERRLGVEPVLDWL